MTGETATRDWTVWGTDARLVLAGPDAHDPTRMRRAAALVDDLLAEIDLACSRFRSDSELNRLHASLPTGAEVSPLLAALVRAALDAAALTEGRVDPTLRYAMDAVGYDRDIDLIEDDGGLIRAVLSPRPGWRSVGLRGHTLQVPAHLALDLGATAKAVASDRAAALVHAELGDSVLVSLGGDISTSGAAPAAGWNVTVRDMPGDPAARVALGPGRGLATSSTQKRRWHRAGLTRHHILDPRTGTPADPVWRTVTVAARTCVRANSFSTGAIVAGDAAPEWLGRHGVPARLVRQDGAVVFTGDWPRDAELGCDAETADLGSAA
ncbi:FAD:protein FMN transferase [Microbacterium aquimaris]|uniref:FAD:protein FMN transferase n=1 Tax=Microbacterium aquimaris TaxID=459816 RepID=A0ABU5N7A2_9MICO|nr:FAD:protein FMN transferase [Microbacterium aquimaris]MDZ8161984.1 FAD:protein FMN transferase [Microbacterium aquimaris]